jgi:hypothetical protein
MLPLPRMKPLLPLWVDYYIDNETNPSVSIQPAMVRDSLQPHLIRHAYCS